MSRPAILYHYTNPEGLLGIIESRVLWATDIEFLNDAQELRFGRDQMRDALLGKAHEISPHGTRGGTPTDSQARIMESAAHELDPSGPDLQTEAYTAYVTSFCEDGDLLSQWRAYGQAGGFAIGFRTSCLGALEPPDVTIPITDREQGLEALQPPEPVRLAKVAYGHDAIAPVVERVLRDIAPSPRGHPGAFGYHQSRVLVLPALATIKHDAFKEEQEWRLIVIGPLGRGSVNFRTGALGIVPYVKLMIPAAAIHSVIVGPGPHPELRNRSVKRLLAAEQLDDIEVCSSEAPFRS